MPRISKQGGYLGFHHGRWSLLYWDRNEGSKTGWKRRRMTLTAMERVDAEAEALSVLFSINEANQIEPNATYEQARPQKAGVVYIVQAGERDLYKIGCTAKDLSLRVDALQTGCPDTLRVLVQFEVADMLTTERALHESLAGYRVRGEWFSIPKQELQSAAASIINR